MTILEPKEFNLLFFLFIFILGIDYLWSGYLILKNNSINIVKPRLLGIWFAKRFLALKSTMKSNTAYMNFFNDIKNHGVLSIIAGILILTGSGIMIFEILFD